MELGYQITNFLGPSYSEPPYFLLLVGLLITLVCGVAFAATLRQSEQKWFRSYSTGSRSPRVYGREAFGQKLGKSIFEGEILQEMEKSQLVIPFLGTCAGVCIFLASGLGNFGLTVILSYVVSVPLTVLIGWLVWFQIGRILGQRIVRSYLAESDEFFPTSREMSDLS